MKHSLFLAIILLLHANTCFGGVKIWINEESIGYWSDPASWEDGSVPVSGDDIHILPPYTQMVAVYDIGEEIWFKSLQIGGSCDEVEGFHTLLLQPDTSLRVDGNLTIGGSGLLHFNTSSHLIAHNIDNYGRIEGNIDIMGNVTLFEESRLIIGDSYYEETSVNTPCTINITGILTLESFTTIEIDLFEGETVEKVNSDKIISSGIRFSGTQNVTLKIWDYHDVAAESDGTLFPIQVVSFFGNRGFTNFEIVVNQLTVPIEAVVCNPLSRGGTGTRIDSCQTDDSNNGYAVLLFPTSSCCNSGWSGIDCQNPLCPGAFGDCGHGICDTSNPNGNPPTCIECGPQWGGPNCDIPVCKNNCNQNGECEIDWYGVPFCNCREGYGASDCSVVTCTNDCFGQGNCLQTNPPICDCEIGYSGIDCSYEDFCYNDCSSRGDCVNYECDCHPNWNGTFCQIPICNGDYYCSDRGQCKAKNNNTNETFCECFEGWTGINCETPYCPNDCSGLGVCNPNYDRPRCECQTGRSGEDCSIILSSNNKSKKDKTVPIAVGVSVGIAGLLVLGGIIAIAIHFRRERAELDRTFSVELAKK